RRLWTAHAAQPDALSMQSRPAASCRAAMVAGQDRSLTLGPALAAQSQSVRIVQRLQPHRRGPHLAQDVALDARAIARPGGRHLAGGENAADAMAVGA